MGAGGDFSPMMSHPACSALRACRQTGGKSRGGKREMKREAGEGKTLGGRIGEGLAAGR